MKIAISSTGATLDDRVHNLFGRCDFFLVVDTETMESKAVKNEFADTASGAGTGCAQVLFNEGVKAVISGQVGPKAYEVLTQSGTEILLSPPGITVREAVTKHKEGSLRKMAVTRF